MEWTDYREKLGIGFDDKQKLEMLKNKIKMYLGGIYQANSLTRIDFENYLLMIGEKAFGNDYFVGFQYSFEISQSLRELMSKYVAFCNTYSDTYHQCEKKYKRDTLIEIIKVCLNSLKIPFEIIEDADGIFIFPKGAKELDNSLVSEPLQWLSKYKYPASHTAFIKALKEYSESSFENASEVADKFRKALETFFQEAFSQNKSLERFKSDYGKLLSEHNVPSEISNNLQVLFDAYTKFNNNYAKHHDKTSMNVLEYIMYATGNIIRLVITLKNN